jgi:hypothetical protein
MFKFFRYLKNQMLLGKRLSIIEEQQKKEGYSITFLHAGTEQYLIYREGEREVSAGISFTYFNDVILYTNSFVKWSTPRGEELTDFDYQKVLNRFVKYCSSWGGDIRLDNSKLEDLEGLKESLKQRGIPFKEIDGVIVYESTVEEERKRKNSFFE